MTYAIGDKVEWNPQPFMSGRKHVGTVVGVVAAGQDIRDIAMEFRYRTLRLPSDAKNPRNHESYLIFVPPATPGGWGKLYWPRVKTLKHKENNNAD